MFKKLIAGGMLACVLAFAACSDKEEEPPPMNAKLTTTPAASATPEPDVAYKSGFFELERDSAGSWRWMSEQGTVKLKNTGKDMKLRIVGTAPLEQIKATPNYKVSFNGETLEDFAAKAEVDKEFVIPAAKQGSGAASELVISASKSFVPKQFDPKSNDERKLSFSLRQLTWETK